MNRYQGIYATAKYLRAHFSKQYTQQWYTEKRAHKLDDRIPATCRWCDDGDNELILQIMQCSSRKEVHTEYKQAFRWQMKEIEAPNHLLHKGQIERDYRAQNASKVCQRQSARPPVTNQKFRSLITITDRFLKFREHITLQLYCIVYHWYCIAVWLHNTINYCNYVTCCNQLCDTIMV